MLNLQKNKNKYFLKERLIIAIIFTIVLLSTLFFQNSFVRFFNFNLYSPQIDGNISIHFIDVGQGKAIGLRFDDGKNMLIDSGPNENKVKLINYLNDKFLTENLVIDYFVLTHTDSDHIGNAITLLEKYEVKNIFLPQIYTSQEALRYSITNTHQIDNSETYTTFLEKAKQESANIYRPEKDYQLLGKNYSCSFLSTDNSEYDSYNDFSLIMMVNYLGFRALFSGDISSKVENDLIESYPQTKLKAELLDVAHHGSKNSTSEEWLKAVTPIYAIISVGENTFGHPSNLVINRLISNGVLTNNIYQTNIDKNIVFTIKADKTVSVNCISNILGFRTFYTWLEIFINLELFGLVFVFVTFLPAKFYKTKKKLHNI